MTKGGRCTTGSVTENDWRERDDEMSLLEEVGASLPSTTPKGRNLVFLPWIHSDTGMTEMTALDKRERIQRRPLHNLRTVR